LLCAFWQPLEEHVKVKLAQFCHVPVKMLPAQEFFFNKSSPHHATAMLTLILFGSYQISLISMMSEHLAHPFVAQSMSYEIICMHDCQILI